MTLWYGDTEVLICTTCVPY